MYGEENGADVNLKVAGQELNVRNVKSLNTILTALTLLGVGIIAASLLLQRADAQTAKAKEYNEHTAIVDAIKTATNASVTAMKEIQAQNVAMQEKYLQQSIRQEQAQRETNCLLSLPQDRRVNSADACRRISR